MKRTPLRRISKKRQAENRLRREILHATYGQYPACQLCLPLRAFGVITGCNGRADDADEVLRRSAGGSITDPANIRPVGRRCHEWLGANPALAREWGLVQSRYGGEA